MLLSTSVRLLLRQWVSFRPLAAPPHSRRTFVKLLIGCVLDPERTVTRAIGGHSPGGALRSVLRLVERAHLSVAELAVGLQQLVKWAPPAKSVNLVIDDTLVPCRGNSGSGIGIEQDHGHKANRPLMGRFTECTAVCGTGRHAPPGPALALGVAPKFGRCGVARLAEGTTLGFASRLAAPRIAGQGDPAAL
jgi:hypothetical protein